MSEVPRAPCPGWWPGADVGLDGRFLAGAFVASVLVALLGHWVFGVGLGETIGGWAVLMLLMCSSRAFQFSIHQAAEDARAAIAETTGREVPSTNPLPRVFHEPRPAGAADAPPAAVAVTAPDRARPRSSVPTVERR